MKLKLILLLLLMPLLVGAQTRRHKHKTKIQKEKQAFDAYYATYKLVPDSAATPYLYYQVYDWIGTRYRFSGKTQKGIDCSGFVGEMYNTVYCTAIARSSSDIWTQVKPIEKNDLQEGDILFFKIKKGKISHVGIYLGHNKFAHASVAEGVVINDLDEAYYKKYFFKGGRILRADN